MATNPEVPKNIESHLSPPVKEGEVVRLDPVLMETEAQDKSALFAFDEFASQARVKPTGLPEGNDIMSA